MRYLKTESGQQAFKERSPLISARQRSLFILIDGQKDIAQVLAATQGLGVAQADVDHLVEQGFLRLDAADQAAVSAAAAAGNAPVRPRSDMERYQQAKPLATSLTASLGLRGFMLNLSVESASGYAELLTLLPKIQDAVGSKACKDLERALKD
jgi:hypothetical protein